jgi:RNA recognition motif-containing protein
MKLYVGNLNFNATEDQLRQVFGAYGELTSVTVITDRETGRSKGFGFVEFASAQEGQAAIEALDGKEVGGRALKVNEARPREGGSGGPRGGGFGGPRGGGPRGGGQRGGGGGGWR